MAISTQPMGRRAFLRSASAAATLTAAAIAAPVSSATAAGALTSGASSGLRRTVPLPTGLQPEGITSGPGAGA